MLRHLFAPRDGWDVTFVRPWFLIRCRDKAAMVRAASRLSGRSFGPGRNVLPVIPRGYERSLGAWVIRVRSYADDVATPSAIAHNTSYLRALLGAMEA